MQVCEQKRLHQLQQLDDAGDDVLADAVDDAEAEAVLTEKPEGDRLQRGPCFASLEIRKGLAEVRDGFDRLVGNRRERAARAALPGSVATRPDRDRRIKALAWG